MAIMLDNPNEAVLPDFTTVEHRDERARLLADGVADEELAAQLLAALWTMSNNAAKAAWAEQVERAARIAEDAQRLADKEEQERQVALEEEQEAARKEEHKKNKAKFAPVATAKAGDYCELYYFTNKGLREARKNLVSSEPQGMILMASQDGQQTWVNADETRDPKSVITKDKNISWEQFNEAAPRMITAMKQHEWPKDRVEMHIMFWTALQNHRWRHAFDVLKQRALLLYSISRTCQWGIL
ncbi:hypothetical protein DFH29DRAFT_983652 [Suillus ampliporus]|nr:hypothetical protein DFH29DRAFT_983652 [Suillus ampliporus]